MAEEDLPLLLALTGHELDRAAFTLPMPTQYICFIFDEAAGASVVTNSAPLTVGTNLVAFDGNNYAGDGINQPTVTTVFRCDWFFRFRQLRQSERGQ